MNSESLIEKIESLSKNDKRKVFDFIEFLNSRKKRAKISQQKKITELENEQFVGIWENRTDMQDSTRWVKKIRQTDWVSG